MRVTARQWKEPDTFGGYPLPQGAQFSKQKPTLDPSIFDSHEEMRPEIRDWVLSQLDNYWVPPYGSWWDWSRVYLAGSTASYWWQGDNDFDILIGINFAKFQRAHPEVASLMEDERSLCAFFNDGFKEKLNTEDAHVPGHDEAYSLTFYANPHSYDIRDIKPYAAYCISENKWYVKPAKMPKDWGAKSFALPFWEKIEKTIKRVDDVLATDDGTERAEDAEALFHELHEGRRSAYSPGGSGVYDPRQLTWLVLERIGVLQKLMEAAGRVGHPVPDIP